MFVNSTQIRPAAIQKYSEGSDYRVLLFSIHLAQGYFPEKETCFTAKTTMVTKAKKYLSTSRSHFDSLTEKHTYFRQFRSSLLIRSSVKPLSEKKKHEIPKNIKHLKTSSPIASNSRASTKEALRMTDQVTDLINMLKIP